MTAASLSSFSSSSSFSHHNSMLSSFSTTPSMSCVSSSSPSVTKEIDVKVYVKIEKISDLRYLIQEYVPRETAQLNKQHHSTIEKVYSKTLATFKNKVGAENYSNIEKIAISHLKRVVPNATENISTNKSLVAKRMFCNLFKKIELMDRVNGDSSRCFDVNGLGFLRRLFPDKDISSASLVIDYSINPDILEKMLHWIEAQNLIEMMRIITMKNSGVTESLDRNVWTNMNNTSTSILYQTVDNTSISLVYQRAQEFRAWISNDNNNAALLNVTELNGLFNPTFLPSEIGKFINLTRLNLNFTELIHLPDAIGNLVNLMELGLSFYRLTELPNSICNLVNLRELDLSNNQLTELPADFGNLVNLRELRLSDNQLTSLPEAINNLVNLRKLWLQDNQLTQLPATIGYLRNLQSLCLCHNQLTELPATIGSLRNLQSFLLSDNPLTQLPATIGYLRNLQWIYLSNVNLTYLPDMTNLSENVRKTIQASSNSSSSCTIQ